HVPEDASGYRIDATRRLIEKYDPGVVQQRDRKRQFLLPAQREVADGTFVIVLQTELFHKRLPLVADLMLGKSVYPSEEFDVFSDGEIVVQSEERRVGKECRSRRST